jgi:nucleotide-binding universal stress UspA family protein
MVEADLEAIDALLEEIWPEKSDRRLRMLVCDNLEVQDEGSESNHQTGEVWEYATALGDLLNAEVSRFCPPPKVERVLHAITEDLVRVGHDLVVVGEGQQPPLTQLLFGSVEKKVVERLTVSVLVACRPRWPLNRILLASRCHDSDDVAADWVIPLARRSGASVTILTIMPPLPAMYQTSIEALLAHNTAPGKQLRQLAGRLEQWNIPGAVCLRQGEPDWQIRAETSEGNYDLIVIAAERTSKLHRLLLGEIVGPLLDWADRPVLIAQPRQIAERCTNSE